MSLDKEPLWATGPGEILRHGVSLLNDDIDSNRRLALISIDNAVELMLQTYITLPERVTGLELTRKTREEICKNFPSLLDGIEKHASDKIIGLELGEIEWFHRLRNNLYHQGNGLTVVRTQVELYAEIAQKLFESLFGIELDIDDTRNMHKFGAFMDEWIKIEKSLVTLSGQRTSYPNTTVVRDLIQSGVITKTQATQIAELRLIRNNLVHGKTEPKIALSKKVLDTAQQIANILATIL